jgi:ribosomal protein L37E
MSPRCNTCGAYFTGNETVCAHCGVPRTAMQPNTAYGPTNQPQFAQPQMAQQCSTCGRFFSGNEPACLSCNTPRGYNQPMGGPAWQQNQVGDAVLMGASVGWTQRYFSPERIIMRRVIGCGITLFLFAACFGIILLTGLAGALFH